MKRYLNKGLFYQGDTKISLPLLVVYFINYFIIYSMVGNFFSYNLKERLYNYWSYDSEMILINSMESWIFMIFYYGICYLIIVGIFKRKKWSTLLSGPFSRLDIRKRELILILISFLVYLFTFILVVLQNIFLNQELIAYLGDFYKVFYLDILRIIALSFISISIVAILDSFFSNAYYFFSSIILLFLYILLLIENFRNVIYNFINEKEYFYKIRDVVIRGYGDGNFESERLGVNVVIYVSIALILLSFLFIYIAKNLTNKMKVENMNEGIIFNFPKKIMKFITSTFLGIAFSSTIVVGINDIYFNYELSANSLISLNILIMIGMSLISYYIIRKLEKNKKDVYYKYS